MVPEECDEAAPNVGAADVEQAQDVGKRAELVSEDGAQRNRRQNEKYSQENAEAFGTMEKNVFYCEQKAPQIVTYSLSK